MKRFLIFALFYPLLTIAGFVLFYVGIVGNFTRSLDVSISFTLSVMAQTFGWIFVAALIPALVLAVVDWFLAGRARAGTRIAATAVIGYAIALLSAFAAWDSSIWLATLATGLMGAVPAALCSWLSGDMRRGAEAA